MGALDSFLSGTPGYFRTGEEVAFPWSAASGVWYALLVVEDGKIVRYGFTAAKAQKANLRAALEKLGGAEATLLGVWHGRNRTDLFILDIQTAIAHL
jgi:hypothetical protein